MDRQLAGDAALDPEPPFTTCQPVCLQRALKCSLSRLKRSQLLPEMSNLLAYSAQFGLGLLVHQIFVTELCHDVQFKLAP